MPYLLFLIGLLIGSFLNVVIYRLEKKEGGILSGRSKCPHCQKILKWFELIPLFSYVIQFGRCRHCQKPISLQYPLVEFFTGLLFVLVYLKFGLTLSSLFLYALCSTLVIIFVYDLKTQTIPDLIVYIGIGLTLIYLLITQTSNLYAWLLGAVIPFVFFGILVLISKETWMGQGDIKLGVLMGLILGYPNILIGLFLAFVLGALVGLILIATKKKTLKSQIPFGPFLITATLITIFYGTEIINWYLGIL